MSYNSRATHTTNIDNERAQRVVLTQGNGDTEQRPLEGILRGVIYNQIVASYPDSVTDVYNYKQDGVSQAIITVTYLDATREKVLEIVRA